MWIWEISLTGCLSPPWSGSVEVMISRRVWSCWRVVFAVISHGWFVDTSASGLLCTVVWYLFILWCISLVPIWVVGLFVVETWSFFYWLLVPLLWIMACFFGGSDFGSDSMVALGSCSSVHGRYLALMWLITSLGLFYRQVIWSSALSTQLSSLCGVYRSSGSIGCGFGWW